MLKSSISLVPARRDLYQAKLVFYLFIASLAMFFIASIITYCVIRVEAFRTVEFNYSSASNSMVESTRVYESLKLPTSFWTSTILLVAISVLLQRAVWFIRRENQIRFRRCLVWAWALAVAFVVIQTFGMSELFAHHFSQTDGSTKVYGMSFTLALIHALHVLGGVVFLGYVIQQAIRNRYDHERHWAVDHCAGYWHFLDVVWLTMLIVFAITK
ncbi:MAG: cytochrome c oxidase subunit 3 [Planctomycetota bacterium]